MDDKIVTPKTGDIPNPEPVLKPTIESSAPPEVEKTSKVEQSQEELGKDTKSKSVDNVVDFDIIGEDYLTNPDWFEIVNYLNLDQNEWQTAKNEVVEIVKYIAQDIQSDKLEDILTKMKAIRSNLYDTGQWGERLHKVLYRYIKLSAKRDSFGKA